MRLIHLSDTKLICKFKKKFNYPEPKGMTSDEWEAYFKNCKENHKVGYFFFETVLDKVEYLLKIPYNIKCFIQNSLSGSNVIKTGLEFGRWHDKDTLFLHGVINLIIDYVEVELAYMQCLCFTGKKFSFIEKLTNKDRSEALGRMYISSYKEELKDCMESVDRMNIIEELYDWAKSFEKELENLNNNYMETEDWEAYKKADDEFEKKNLKMLLLFTKNYRIFWT